MTNKNEISNVTLDISKTDDIRTDDFDLSKDKIPALSTIKTQIRNAKTLIETGHTIPIRTEFDRLKIGVEIVQYGKQIEFANLGMEVVEDPIKPPSYIEDKENKCTVESLVDMPKFTSEEDDDGDLDTSDLDEIEEMSIADVDPDVLKNKKAKRRIPFNVYKNVIGLNNIYIHKGFFVIDITGKFMSGPGVLGSLHKDNFRTVLQKILDLEIVAFDIDKFFEYAQVFICDVCVDLKLCSIQQVYRYIDGLSSFFPLSSLNFNIAKYGRHGMQILPKADNSGFSLVAYSKGQELDSSTKRSTKATKYTYQIGTDGQELAQRTLRLEVKLFTLNDIRECLNIPKKTKRVVKLVDVLNSTAPVMLNMFEFFSGSAEILLDRLTWLSDIAISDSSNLNLKDIALAEWFVDILKDNCFSIELAKAHIKTEYINVRDKELENFNRLANHKRHVLNYLVYRKPKSITIMLSLLSLLQAYYSTGMEGLDG